MSKPFPSMQASHFFLYTTPAAHVSKTGCGNIMYTPCLPLVHWFSVSNKITDNFNIKQYMTHAYTGLHMHTKVEGKETSNHLDIAV